MWVPTQWQYDCIIEQGYPKERVFVVNEGVSKEFFTPSETTYQVEKEYDAVKPGFIYLAPPWYSRGSKVYFTKDKYEADFIVYWTKDKNNSITHRAKQENCEKLFPHLKQELNAYTYKVNQNGLITFNSPSGFHDDCVMSLMLANEAREKLLLKKSQLYIGGPKMNEATKIAWGGQGF
jgi:hypothetical protein